MNQFVIIDKFCISRKNCPAGMTKIRVAGETIGLIETIKLLDDLPRIINHPLTETEQAWVSYIDENDIIDSVSESVAEMEFE